MKVTDKAFQAVIKYLAANDAPEGSCLRVGVRGGGCSGLSYALEITNSVNKLDEVHEKEGCRVVVDPKSSLLLNSTTLDYVTGLLESGFKFNNPKAGKTCGCGESFSA